MGKKGSSPNMYSSKPATLQLARTVHHERITAGGDIPPLRDIPPLALTRGETLLEVATAQSVELVEKLGETGGGGGGGGGGGWGRGGVYGKRVFVCEPSYVVMDAMSGVDNGARGGWI